MGPVSNLPDVGPASISGGVDGAGGAAIDGHDLTVGQVGGGVAGGDHGGGAVVAGDQGGMGGQGAAVGDHLNRVGNQRRPGRSGGPSDQHLTGLEVIEVIGPMDDADR